MSYFLLQKNVYCFIFKPSTSMPLTSSFSFPLPLLPTFLLLPLSWPFSSLRYILLINFHIHLNCTCSLRRGKRSSETTVLCTVCGTWHLSSSTSGCASIRALYSQSVFASWQVLGHIQSPQNQSQVEGPASMKHSNPGQSICLVFYIITFSLYVQVSNYW